MFIGRYYHRLEQKGRLAIPKAFRTQLASGGVITTGLDGCLYLFPNSYWKKLTNKLALLPLTNQTARDFTRLLVQSAVSLQFDSQGRTLLPDYLRNLAQLKDQVVLAGSLSHIEIWDRDSYHQHFDTLATNPKLLENLNNLNV